VQQVSLDRIRQRVHEVAEAIQPRLHPHPGLARRNAHAHIWLGISERFGQDWRERADLACVLEMVEWFMNHPNDGYKAFAGPVRHRTPEQRGLLFETEPDR
jgi:hypothetical protein